MRVLIGCGGTGGHIYPAISIADGLRKTFSDSTILFIGAIRGVEMDLVAAAGYQIVGVPIKGLQRGKILPNFLLPFLLFKSIYQARQIIQSFNPDVVVGTGGYACFPALFAAYSLNIPTLIQEQNSVAGLTNKLFSKLVTKISTGYPAVDFPCAKEKIIVTGNPIRSSINITTKERVAALRYFNLSPSKKCLLVVGGSGGAGKLNATILAGIKQFSDLDIQLLWITGNRYFKAIDDAIQHHNGDGNIRCYPFVSHMEMAYLAANVVISRAGALSIAELCVARKPTILVPSPNVVGDHQTKNSLPLKKKGAVILLAEHQCSQLLVPTAIALLNNQVEQAALVKQMDSFSLLHAHALTKIIEIIFSLAKLKC